MIRSDWHAVFDSHLQDDRSVAPWRWLFLSISIFFGCLFHLELPPEFSLQPTVFVSPGFRAALKSLGGA